jgi:hypothetical protein
MGKFHGNEFTLIAISSLSVFLRQIYLIQKVPTIRDCGWFKNASEKDQTTHVLTVSVNRILDSNT